MNSEMTMAAPHPARFSFVAVRQRPLREIVGIAEASDGTTLTLSCGHVAQHAQHFTYTLGAKTPCLACGKALASELPEFKGFFDASGKAITSAARPINSRRSA